MNYFKMILTQHCVFKTIGLITHSAADNKHSNHLCETSDRETDL